MGKAGTSETPGFLSGAEKEVERGYCSISGGFMHCRRKLESLLEIRNGVIIVTE